MVIECLAEIVDFPASSNKTLGSNATFHCAGHGDELFWQVDGASETDPAVKNRSITFNSEYDDTSDLFTTCVHVPCALENNNTEVTCVVVENGKLVYSDAALLLIQGKYHLSFFLVRDLIASLFINNVNSCAHKHAHTFCRRHS